MKAKMIVMGDWVYRGWNQVRFEYVGGLNCTDIVYDKLQKSPDGTRPYGITEFVRLSKRLLSKDHCLFVLSGEGFNPSDFVEHVTKYTEYEIEEISNAT